MFSDPLSVTVNAVATSFPRTKLGSESSEYTTADGNLKVTVKQNQTASRFRREIRLSQQKISADPISAVNSAKGASVYLVIDEPKTGFSDTELQVLLQALVGSTLGGWGTLQLKLLGGEY